MSEPGERQVAREGLLQSGVGSWSPASSPGNLLERPGLQAGRGAWGKMPEVGGWGLNSQS